MKKWHETKAGVFEFREGKNVLTKVVQDETGFSVFDGATSFTTKAEAQAFVERHFKERE